MNKRIEAVYSGVVQGVGFRYTAQKFARDLSISGYVKNLPTGAVEIIAEGREEDLKQFLERINRYFKSYIEDTRVSWGEPSVEFDSFDIA